MIQTNPLGSGPVLAAARPHPAAAARAAQLSGAGGARHCPATAEALPGVPQGRCAGPVRPGRLQGMYVPSVPLTALPTK